MRQKPIQQLQAQEVSLFVFCIKYLFLEFCLDFIPLVCSCEFLTSCLRLFFLWWKTFKKTKACTYSVQKVEPIHVLSTRSLPCHFCDDSVFNLCDLPKFLWAQQQIKVAFCVRVAQNEQNWDLFLCWASFLCDLSNNSFFQNFSELWHETEAPGAKSFWHLCFCFVWWNYDQEICFAQFGINFCPWK